MITAIDLAVMRYPEDCGGYFVINECLPHTFVDMDLNRLVPDPWPAEEGMLSERRSIYCYTKVFLTQRG
jgi:hypothetical protein